MEPGKKTRIVSGGGGFAGLYAAKQLDATLATRADIEVTPISRENFIVFSTMVDALAAGALSPGDIVRLRRIIRSKGAVVA